MQQWKEGLLATKSPRPRRRLQKTVTKQHINTACRFDSSPSTDSSLPATWTQPRRPPTPPKHNRERPSPQREGRPYERQQPLDPLEQYPSHIVPKASHFIPTNPQLHSSSGSVSSCKSSTQKMRRRAHSPAFSIGQHDFPKPPTHVLTRTSSVDLIAEQYKAFLESRPSSADSDDFSEPALSPEISDRDEPLALPRQHSSSYVEREPRISHPPRRTTDIPKPSPMSDDGSTLVSFKDEAVYFKPFAFSPEAENYTAAAAAAAAAATSEPPDSPTLPHYYHPNRHSITTTTATEDDDNTDTNVGLQICLDLLTRELAAALPVRPSSSSSSAPSPPPRTAALQVWAMIEAYEGLRDQMAELSQTHEQARAMEGMFDMWLRALYSVHDGMTGCRRAGLMDCGAEFGK